MFIKFSDKLQSFSHVFITWNEYVFISLSFTFQHQDNSGGGSGGRIAIYQREHKRFRGTVSALGGACSSSSHGGPGSVVNVVTIGTDIETYLEIDHLGRNGELTCAHPIVLAVDGQFQFEEIYLKRTACFSLSTVNIIIYQRSLEIYASKYHFCNSPHLLNNVWQEWSLNIYDKCIMAV